MINLKRKEKREEFAQPKCMLESFNCRTRSHFLANLLLQLALLPSKMKSKSNWMVERMIDPSFKQPSMSIYSSSYRLTTGMTATISKPWCLLDLKSSTLLLVYGHGNLGGSVGVNIHSNEGQMPGQNSPNSYKYHQRTISKREMRIGVQIMT